MIKRDKVLTYITHGNKLLVFTHPESPEAGIQVPGGTVEPDESVEDAALREATEETGLHGLRLGTILGDFRRDMSDYNIAAIWHIHFFHIWCDEEPPASWRHYEYTASDRAPGHEPIPFDFYWLDLTLELPPLYGYHATYIPQLKPFLGL